MRSSQRIRFWSAALTLVVALSACNKQSQPPGSAANGAPTNGTTGASGKRAKRIVFIFKSAGQYSEACRKGAMQANDALKAQGVSVEYQAPETADVSKQQEMMDQQIAAHVDAIVISPNDDKAIVPIIKKAMDAGVKVFTWDSDAPDSQRIFYVSAADDVQIGSDIADALAKDLGGKGKVQIMSGGRNAFNLNQHVTGMEEAFKKYPGITLVQPYIYDNDSDKDARSMAIQAFQKDPDIAGFACANSPSPPAAGEAITQLNKIGKVKVWGLSLPSLTGRYLKSGAISGVMLWDPAKLTSLTAQLVSDYLNGKMPEDGAEFPDIGKIHFKNGRVLMPGITFTKDNVDQFSF